ncbi:hypothetical protein WP50_25140, partial [Lactiplantibacillus plantarum]
DIRQSFAHLNAMVEENISGNRIVRAFAREDYEIEKFQQLNHDYKEKNMASAAVSRRYLPTLDFLASLLSVIVLLLGSILVINHQMQLAINARTNYPNTHYRLVNDTHEYRSTHCLL